ncbi:MAG TPA: sialidase family protein [Chitinophagaceae bacterium]|nr:sialidase family protein [Chitinophagaceae bacterium]
MKNVLILFVPLLGHFSHSQTTDHYLKQALPGDVPKIFSPGVISNGFANRDFTISPAGDEIFFTIQQLNIVSVVMNSTKKNGKWSEPAVAPFSGIYNDLEASFTADGNRLFFSSNRPVNRDDSTNDYNIWYITKKNGTWSEPISLDSLVNSDKDEFYPSVAKNGNLYFTTQIETGKGKEDIVVCEFENGHYLPPASLPEAINSKGYEFNAFVDPDEQYILFTAYGRSDDMGHGDLYLSIKKDDQWQPAVNLAKINSVSLDYCPFVTWDKKYLFFTSSKASYKSPFKTRQSATDLRKGLSNPGNGLDDIYWVRFDNILNAVKR